MSQLENGNQESTEKTYTQKQLDIVREKLKKYEDLIGTNKVKYNVDVEEYLNLSSIQLRAMSSDECSIGAYELSRYAYIIQKEQNQVCSELAWAKHNLDVIIGKQANNYDKYKKFEERAMLVINEDSYAKALNEIILVCKIRSESLNFLSGKVTTISNRLSELSYAKRSVKNE